jgi:hypothetical protein
VNLGIMTSGTISPITGRLHGRHAGLSPWCGLAGRLKHDEVPGTADSVAEHLPLECHSQREAGPGGNLVVVPRCGCPSEVNREWNGSQILNGDPAPPLTCVDQLRGCSVEERSRGRVDFVRNAPRPREGMAFRVDPQLVTIPPSTRPRRPTSSFLLSWVPTRSSSPSG